MARHEAASLSVRSVTVDRAGHPVLHNVNLMVAGDTRMAVVGPNGVGKSTLLAVMAGRIEPASGSVTVDPPAARVGLVDQEPERSHDRTGRDMVARRVGVAAARAEFEAAAAGLSAPPGKAADSADRYDRALTAWEQLGGFDFDHRLDSTARRLGLEPTALDQPTTTLSGGQLTKIGLAAIMVSRFDITLLDEPTNNLDRDGLELLEQWVNDLDRPLVLVSHDRSFLERAVTSVARIVANGFNPVRGNVEVFTGGWSAYQDQLAVAARQAEERYERFDRERRRLRRLAQQKREWADRGSSRARRAPADNDRHRYMHDMAGADSQIGAAKAVAKRLEKLEESTGWDATKPWRPWELQFSIAESDRGSGEVVVADGAVFQRSRPEGLFTLGPLSLVIGWGERLLVDGPNGSGKTTLLDGLFGPLDPVAGRVSIGPSIVVGRIGQLRSALVDDHSLLQVFADRSRLDYTEARSLLAKFGLDAAAVDRRADSVSPGQRTRAELALFQARGVNTIVLDEPTNHLDIEAIQQLEQALSNFGGTLIVVSHDRRFRDGLDITRMVDVTDLSSATSS